MWVWAVALQVGCSTAMAMDSNLNDCLDSIMGITSIRLEETPTPTVASYDDRSSLDPLIARMRALKCKYAISAEQQRHLLELLPRIRQGESVNLVLPNTNGNTALHYSCGIGSLNITKWLLEHGANPNARNNYGEVPLQCVGNDNRAAIIQALKNYGAQSVTSYDDRSSLDPLIARMRALKCKYAISAEQQRHLLELLPRIRQGESVNLVLPNTNGNTALHYSCGIGSLNITKWLLEHGANPNARNNYGEVPLQCVGNDNRAAIIQALKNYGAQSVTSYDDRSSLDPLIARMRALKCKYAISAEQQRHLLELLPRIRQGESVNLVLPNTYGNTALHYSCGIGSLSITKWLLTHGANPNIRNHNGKTPLHCVGDDNRAAIIQALKNYGAQW